MSKILILCATFATTLCCDLPQFNVSIKKESSEITLLYSKEAIKDSLYVYVFEENIPVLCKGTFSDLSINKIRLIQNNIQRIEPGAFANLPKLNIAILMENKLEAIENGVFEHKNLMHIGLSLNSIARISSNAFRKLPNLQFIDLSFNSLNYVDVNWFKHNPKLMLIHLVKNKIVSIPEGFLSYNLPHKPALSVDLSKNPIEIVADAAFDNMRALSVYLGKTKLKKLSKMFKKIGEVERLHISSDRTDCFSREELDNIKLSKTLEVNKESLPIGCYETLEVWGKENNVKIQQKN